MEESIFMKVFFIYRWFVIRWQTLTAINNVWPFEILIGERCNGDT